MFIDMLSPRPQAKQTGEEEKIETSCTLSRFRWYWSNDRESAERRYAVNVLVALATAVGSQVERIEPGCLSSILGCHDRKATG